MLCNLQKFSGNLRSIHCLLSMFFFLNWYLYFLYSAWKVSKFILFSHYLKCIISTAEYMISSYKHFLILRLNRVIKLIHTVSELHGLLYIFTYRMMHKRLKNIQLYILTTEIRTIWRESLNWTHFKKYYFYHILCSLNYFALVINLKRDTNFWISFSPPPKKNSWVMVIS